MRSFVRAAVATVAVLGAAAAARAQTPEAPSAAEAPAQTAPAGPSTPIPYSQLRPKPAAPRPSPKPAATAATGAKAAPLAAAAPVVASAPPVAPGAHIVAGARLTPGQSPAPAELEAFVDGVVKDAMARQHLAGVTVSVVQNGQLLLKKGYGFASLAPRRAVDPDRTLFRLGGLSRAFTWVGLMKQAEAGKVGLDQPVNRYLPRGLQIPDQGYAQPVRVIDLLDHAEGFDDRTFGRLYERKPEYVRSLARYLQDERPRRVRPPGQVASDNVYGAALAGQAIAGVSGKTFERLMEEQIFVPLGMKHTTFRERRAAAPGLPAPMPEALGGDVADGFSWTNSGFERRDYQYMGQIAPAASAASTAGDMARYMLALLGGGQYGGVTLYGPRTAQAFRTPILSAPDGINGWAHGLRVETLPGGRTGYGEQGETLAFSAKMLTVPELNLGVFIATNSASGGALVDGLPAAIVQQFYAAPPSFPPAGSQALAQDPAAFEGRYLSSRRGYGGLEGFVQRFTSGAEVRVTPSGRLVTRALEGTSVWTPAGAPDAGSFIGADGGGRLAFQMSDGKALSFRTAAGDELFERLEFWQTPQALGLVAALTAAAALATLLGVITRNRRDFRESPVQSRAALVQNIQAGLWLAAMVLFGLWMAKIADPTLIAYAWPGVYVVVASACCLVAAALTITTLVALPAIWGGGRRVDSWTAARKLAFTVTVLVYAGFSVILALWGALLPWGA